MAGLEISQLQKEYKTECLVIYKKNYFFYSFNTTRYVVFIASSDDILRVIRQHS